MYVYRQSLSAKRTILVSIVRSVFLFLILLKLTLNLNILTNKQTKHRRVHSVCFLGLISDFLLEFSVTYFISLSSFGSSFLLITEFHCCPTGQLYFFLQHFQGILIDLKSKSFTYKMRAIFTYILFQALSYNSCLDLDLLFSLTKQTLQQCSATAFIILHQGSHFPKLWNFSQL